MTDDSLLCDLSNDVLRLKARQQTEGNIVISLLDADIRMQADLGRNQNHKHSILKDLQKTFPGVTRDHRLTQITIPLQGKASDHRQAVATHINGPIAISHDLLTSGQKRIELPHYIATTQLAVEAHQLPDGAVKIITRPIRHPLETNSSPEEVDQLAAIDAGVDRRFTSPPYDVQRGRLKNADTTSISLPKNGTTAFHHGQDVANCLIRALNPYRTDEYVLEAPPLVSSPPAAIAAEEQPERGSSALSPVRSFAAQPAYTRIPKGFDRSGGN